MAGASVCVALAALGLYLTSYGDEEQPSAEPVLNLTAPSPRAACTIPAASWEELRGVLPRRLEAEMQRPPKVMPAHPGMGVPAEMQLAMGHLLRFLRQRAGCPPGSDWALACPAHRQWAGSHLSVIAEALRRHAHVERPGFCDQVFAHVPYPLRNSPGALLQQTEYVHRTIYRAGERLPKTRVHVLSFQQRSMLGAGFLPALFGYITDHSCTAEVEMTCSARLERNRSFTYRSWLRRGGGDVYPTFVSFPKGPYRLIMDNWHRTSWPKEADMLCPDAARVRDQYARMRTILPIHGAFWRPRLATRRPLEIVVHIRGGGGSKSPPEVAFMPMVDRLREGLRQRGRESRVHVFHETVDDVCCPLFAARARDNPAEYFVYIDRSRYALFQTMWDADILVAGLSKFSHLAGQLSPNARIVIDGDITNCCRPRTSTAFKWIPCAEWVASKKMYKHHNGSCSVTLGIDADKEAALDAALDAWLRPRRKRPRPASSQIERKADGPR